MRTLITVLLIITGIFGIAAGSLGVLSNMEESLPAGAVSFANTALEYADDGVNAANDWLYDTVKVDLLGTHKEKDAPAPQPEGDDLVELITPDSNKNTKTPHGNASEAAEEPAATEPAAQAEAKPFSLSEPICLYALEILLCGVIALETGLLLVKFRRK